MKNDDNLLLVLAIQYKYKMDFLLNLVDTFDRARIAQMSKVPDYNVTQWIRDSEHVQRKKDIKIHISQKDATYADVCKHAIESFAKRCCDGLIFNSVVKIDDSLQRIVKYVYSCTAFIQNLMKTKKMDLLPFQVYII